jgi:hypothetical protein
MLNSLKISTVLLSVLIVYPANALIFNVDEMRCPAYSADNVVKFFDSDETYISGLIAEIGPKGLLNTKHPSDISIQKTNKANGLFYEVYQIKPLFIVKSDNEIQIDKTITVLDLSSCEDCDIKAQYPGTRAFCY